MVQDTLRIPILSVVKLRNILELMIGDRRRLVYELALSIQT